jgi:hypothetical protein
MTISQYNFCHETYLICALQLQHYGADDSLQGFVYHTQVSLQTLMFRTHIIL